MLILGRDQKEGGNPLPPVKGELVKGMEDCLIGHDSVISGIANMTIKQSSNESTLFKTIAYQFDNNK